MGRFRTGAANVLAKGTVLWAFAFLSVSAQAIDASNRYRSPRNPERRIRASTELIVLHTTEAPARSSLNKVSERGECHYCVTEDGTIYRIVDRDREAFHAGRSMWNGKEDVDKFSIGIECVGYHDQAMPLKQLEAIRDLVRELKGMYSLTDDKVVSHSAVAYGKPNRWQKSKHRGRKRCGMLFAMPSVRKVLELKTRVAKDPDTQAKRLVVADAYLESVLYGKTDTMRGTYSAAALAASAAGSGIMKWFRKADPAPKPAVAAAPPPASPGSSAPKAATPAPKAANPAPKAGTKQKATAPLPPKSVADLKARGYVCRGTVSKGHSASKIAGARWNSSETYYVIRNRVTPGNQVNPSRIEIGTAVWMRK